ncbi:AraC family transcriptional regulator [Paenibacillus aestuarii]|nr:AraC family transcriptional regulator [Paenibacillus aestuarii]
MSDFLRIPDILHATAGTVIYPPGGRFGPRTQPDIQLVLLHTGQMTVYIDDVPHEAQPGHVVLLKPGHMEQFFFAKAQETWHRWIAVHMQKLTAEQLAHLQQLPFSIPISENMNRLTDLMLSLRHSQPDTAEVICSLGLAAIQLYASEMSGSRPQDTHPSVSQAVAYIEQHYPEELTLEQIARCVSLSPEHLVRLFRKYENVTPVKYLWHYRMLKANELLAQTGLPIGDVAARCGFKTSFHFARMFKQMTGMTPSAYRRHNWDGLQNEKSRGT